MKSGFQDGHNQSDLKEIRTSDARHSLLLGLGTTDCCLEQMTLVCIFSIVPEGMQTGPDYMCARLQVKRFYINCLFKISLLDSGKHVHMFILRVG